jgi:hypothetical protein
MSNRRRREPDKALARAFVRNARTFHEAGQMAWDRKGASSAYNLAIAIELGLKAYLLHRGITDQWNRIHLRHDLTKALRCARMAGLKDIPEGIAQMVEVLSPLYASGALSRGLGEPSWPISPREADEAIVHLLDGLETSPYSGHRRTSTRSARCISSPSHGGPAIR